MIPRVELAPGYTISRVLKGGWQLAGGHGPVDDAAALDDMDRFVEAGITTFDCADIYTGVEALIGRWRKRRKGRAGAPTDVQVHTKYVPDLDRLPTHSRADVVRGVDRSLARLGVERSISSSCTGGTTAFAATSKRPCGSTNCGGPGRSATSG
jgi:aryl-alcohol dehydrogenase-like predicted oxidoreductase